MNKISYIDALSQFNARVLTQGIPAHGTEYNPKSLADLLFFNKVFLSNTDEMFEKNEISVNDLTWEYHKTSIERMNQNVDEIIAAAPFKVEHDDSFEKRLQIVKHIYERAEFIIRQIDFNNISTRAYPAISGQIYYIAFRDNNAIIYTTNNNSSIYNALLYNGDVMWKTDECIIRYLMDVSRTEYVISFRPVIGDRIAKAEYNYIGDADKTLQRYIDMFMKYYGIETSIRNRYMYLDDIEKMFDRYIDEKPEEIQCVKDAEALTVMQEDKLLEYPYDSFESYLDFLRSAVVNPETTDIYITLYRVGNDASLYYVLKEAVEHNIRVHVNLELRASGEEINMFWMDEFRNVGIDVTTYMDNVMKVHAKLTLVKFANGKAVCQIGTGNYNYSTTKQYTDLSFITSDDEICHQVEKLFFIFNGYDTDVNSSFTNDLLVTPYNAKRVLIELIEHEARKEENGYICIKCNTLTDPDIIRYLNRAAINGCIIHLIVRGACTWVPDKSCDNVIIKSIVWSKLEHSRIYAFGKSNPTIYIGSLDPVESKFNKRIETLVRVNNPDIVIKLCKYLNRYITCTTGAWIMKPDGTYRKEVQS